MPKSRPSLSLQGDCMELLRQLPDGCIDACVADPPYNMSKKKGLKWAFSRHVTMEAAWDRFTDEEYFRFSLAWLKEVCRVVKPNGNLFVFGTYHNIYTLGFLIQRLDLKILNSIIWVKPNAQPNITCRMLTESSEQLIWAANNTTREAKKWLFNYAVAKELNGGKQMRNVWEFPLTPRREKIGSHPSQKPEKLLERILHIATAPGDWVLDPFGGTGTTGVAALKTGRRCVLMERDPEYFAVQKARFETLGLEKSIVFLDTSAAIRDGLETFASPPSLRPRAVDAVGLS